MIHVTHFVYIVQLVIVIGYVYIKKLAESPQTNVKIKRVERKKIFAKHRVYLKKKNGADLN